MRTFYQSPALKTIYCWVDRFKCVRTSTQDGACPVWRAEVTTPGMIEKIYRIGMEDHLMKVRDIAKILEIFVDRVHNEVGLK